VKFPCDILRLKFAIYSIKILKIYSLDPNMAVAPQGGLSAINKPRRNF
jgi:hypothetical protein